MAMSMIDKQAAKSDKSTWLGALQQEFRKQTGPLTGATLAATCRRAPGHQ